MKGIFDRAITVQVVAILTWLVLLFSLEPATSLAIYQIDESVNDKLNVLFIAVDDLRPELGCYGSKTVHSPNIDRFAKSALVFRRAYCQQSICNPSRTSIMTGLRPDTIGVTGNHIHFRSNMPDVVTLPQHFKNNGYHAAAIGKLYHGVFPDGSSNTKWDTMGDPISWSEPAMRFGPRYYYTEEGIEAAKKTFLRVYKPTNPAQEDWTKKLVFGPATESPDVADNTLYDGKVADAAIVKLGELQKRNKPFFLAVGFIKPHSPYIAPKKYFEQYATIEIATDQHLPSGAPKFAGHGSGELRRYTDQPSKGPISVEKQKRVRQAYYACTSFIDAQIGRILNSLESQGLAENTVVCLFGDHGYHLGEHGLWGKTTNFELDTRVPLIVRSPGMKAAGQTTNSLVELVDLYPTLSDVCGLTVDEALEGNSFAALLDDPNHETKNVALSQYPRGGGLMGYSMRTATHRLTQWIHQASNEIRATELYDYSAGSIEQKNLAEDPMSQPLLENLRTQINQAFAINLQKNNATKTTRRHMLSVPPKLGETPSEKDVRPNPDDRPNILLIISEDNGPELGCYGDKYAQTPNLDRLASEGVRFKTAYVTQAVCSSSRSSILTGLYPHQNGQIGLATHRFSMFREWPTTYSILKKAGYRTGMIGKLHVNPESTVDKWIDFRAIPSANFGKKDLANYSKKSAEFISSSNKPFFLSVNLPDAHWPVQNTVEGRPRSLLNKEDVRPMEYIGFDNDRLRGHVQGYYNSMSRLDECVGELLTALQNSGKAENTLVIYIGDHGAQFARGKVFVTEGGLRIPFLIRWPGKSTVGHVSEQMVSTIDLLPTIVKAAGEPVPANLRGIDLAGVLDGDHEPIREYLFGERNTDAAVFHYPQRSVRDTRHKLIKTLMPGTRDPATHKYLVNGASNFRGSPTYEELEVASKRTQQIYVDWLNPPEYQLFDLQNDPSEFTNLANDSSKTEIKTRLIARLEKWQLETDDMLRHPELLAKLTAEVDACLKKQIRVPKGGWKYLDYLNPTPGDSTIKQQDPLDFERQVIFQQRNIPDGVPKKGQAINAKTYGYRIPSLLVTQKNSLLAFTERRMGLHDHAQNDIVLKRSTDSGRTWSDEIVAFEDGINSINDPLTVQLDNGRILLMFARFPYGRHARASGWIKMAELGYDNPETNVLTYICHSDDDGLTWSRPVDVTKSVKAPHLLNANTPGSMIQLTTGKHSGRIVTGLWGTLPVTKNGKVSRAWQIVVAYSDDYGKTWVRTDPLIDASGKGFPNECQVVEASNGDIILISRNQEGETFRKKAISKDGGVSWSKIDIDRTLPSVACMGAVVKGPVLKNGKWDLYASFPSSKGRFDGQIAVSKDNGQSWQIKTVVKGPFAYSALQVSPDRKSLLCLYESDDYKTETLLTIPFTAIAD